MNATFDPRYMLFSLASHRDKPMKTYFLSALICCAWLAPATSIRPEKHAQVDSVTSAQMERIMFVNEIDALQYKNQCGSGWHRIFGDWEIRQRGALRRDPDVKAVVWRCRRFCGGLGDRQRGILTSFAFALATDRAFFIDSENPVPLQHFFHVANPELHWTYDEGLLEGRTHLEEDFLNSFPSVGDFASANLSYYDDYDVVIQINNFWRPLGILRNPAFTSASLLNSYKDYVLAGCILNYLLVPARDLQMQIYNRRSVAMNSRKKVLALQIRSGDSQSKNETVLQGLEGMFRNCVDHIVSLSLGSFMIFLTTDSVDIARSFEALSPDVFMFGGDITHVDGAFGTTDSPAAAFRKVVLDHIMISQADVLIISRSGFGEMAAMRGFKPYYNPLQCNYGKPVPHYSFPNKEPQGVPATEIHKVEDIFANFKAAQLQGS